VGSISVAVSVILGCSQIWFGELHILSRSIWTQTSTLVAPVLACNVVPCSMWFRVHRYWFVADQLIIWPLFNSDISVASPNAIRSTPSCLTLWQSLSSRLPWSRILNTTINLKTALFTGSAPSEEPKVSASRVGLRIVTTAALLKAEWAISSELIVYMHLGSVTAR
jgi:hypothetical protein